MTPTQIAAILIFTIFGLVLSVIAFALIVSAVRQGTAKKRVKKFLSEHPEHAIMRIAYSAFDGDSIINFYSVNGEPPAYYNGNLYLPTGEVTVRADFQITSLEKPYTGGNGPDASRQFRSDMRFLWRNNPKNADGAMTIRFNAQKGGDYTIKPNQRTKALELVCIEGDKHCILEFKG